MTLVFWFLVSGALFTVFLGVMAFIILVIYLYIIFYSSERSYIMGRSLAMAEFVGTRVAGQLTWVPAHIKPDGEKVMSRVEIPVYANMGKGKDPKTGEKGRKDAYKFVVWGPMADTCCKSLPTGRGLSIFGRPDPYMGKLYNADHTPRLDIAGKEILIPKMAFVVFDLKFEDDSAKQIATEKQDGRRPLHWDVPNHPDWALWVKILNDRQATVWNGNTPTFGYARVVLPRSPGAVIDFEALQPKKKQTQGYIQTGFPQQSLPNMVANAFGANVQAAAGHQPLFDPYTGQPIVQQAPQQPVAKFDPYTGQPIQTVSPFQPTAPAGMSVMGLTPTTPVIQGTSTSLF